METRLHLDIQAQPDDASCGPTCLHAVYRYYGDLIDLHQVIEEVDMLDEGGTLAVLLACHALKRGYQAKIYTYNLHVFDPLWFKGDACISERLQKQMKVKKVPKLQFASKAYLEFLERGGRLEFQDLTSGLIIRYLSRSIPILTGLSATYLYRASREIGDLNKTDDIRGEPAGHFVVLSGYRRQHRDVLVADPYRSNPMSDTHYYLLDIERVICAILLGIVTYDANLLIIEPPTSGAKSDASSDHS